RHTNLLLALVRLGQHWCSFAGEPCFTLFCFCLPASQSSRVIALNLSSHFVLFLVGDGRRLDVFPLRQSVPTSLQRFTLCKVWRACCRDYLCVQPLLYDLQLGNLLSGMLLVCDTSPAICFVSTGAQ